MSVVIVGGGLMGLSAAFHLRRADPGRPVTVLERAVKIVSNFKIGIAIKKGRDDVVAAFHDALVVVQNDGTQKALYEKYKIDPALAVPSEILKQ